MRHLTSLFPILFLLLMVTGLAKSDYRLPEDSVVEVEVRAGNSPLPEASVALDLNNNGVWDEWEPREWTDANGYVVFYDVASVDEHPDAQSWEMSQITLSNVRGLVGATELQVDFALPAGATKASLELFDLTGRRIAGTEGLGDLELNVPADLASGAYFLRISSGPAEAVSQRITSISSSTRVIKANRFTTPEAVAGGWTGPLAQDGQQRSADSHPINLIVEHPDYPAVIQAETLASGTNSFSVYMGPDFKEDVAWSEELGLEYVSRTADTITFEYEGEAPDVSVGDILIGIEDGGYVARVTAVEIDRAFMVIHWVHGSLWELFDGVEVDTVFDFDEPPIDYQFNNTILLDEVLQGEYGAVQATVSIPNGRLTYSPSLEFGFRIENEEFTNFKAILGGQIGFDADILLAISGSVVYESDPVSLFSVQKTIWIPKTPLFVISEFEIEAGCNIDHPVDVGSDDRAQIVAERIGPVVHKPMMRHPRHQDGAAFRGDHRRQLHLRVRATGQPMEDDDRTSGPDRPIGTQQLRSAPVEHIAALFGSQPVETCPGVGRAGGRIRSWHQVIGSTASVRTGISAAQPIVIANTPPHRPNAQVQGSRIAVSMVSTPSSTARMAATSSAFSATLMPERRTP